MARWVRWLLSAAFSVTLIVITSLVVNLISSSIDRSCPSQLDIGCYIKTLPLPLSLVLIVLWSINVACYPRPRRVASVTPTEVRTHWLARGQVIQRELAVTLALAQQGVGLLDQQEIVPSPTIVSVEDVKMAQDAWRQAGDLLKTYREQHTRWRAAFLDTRSRPQSKRRQIVFRKVARRLASTIRILIVRMPSWPITDEHKVS